jgi:hypothetical protein
MAKTSWQMMFWLIGYLLVVPLISQVGATGLGIVGCGSRSKA